MCAVLQVPIATFKTAERAAQFLAYMKEEQLPIPTTEEKKKAKKEARGALLLQGQACVRSEHCVCAASPSACSKS